MTRRIVVSALLTSLALAPAALAGPDPEPPGNGERIHFLGPSSKRIGAGHHGVVAEVGWYNDGLADSRPAEACVTLPRGFRDISVGVRRKVRVASNGRYACWYVGRIETVADRDEWSAEADIAIRATAPRRPGRYTVTLRLREVGSFGGLTEEGTVRVVR